MIAAYAKWAQLSWQLFTTGPGPDIWSPGPGARARSPGARAGAAGGPHGARGRVLGPGGPSLLRDEQAFKDESLGPGARGPRARPPEPGARVRLAPGPGSIPKPCPPRGPGPNRAPAPDRAPGRRAH